jgi:hypothetical protein
MAIITAGSCEGRCNGRRHDSRAMWIFIFATLTSYVAVVYKVYTLRKISEDSEGTQRGHGHELTANGERAPWAAAAAACGSPWDGIAAEPPAHELPHSNTESVESYETGA